MGERIEDIIWTIKNGEFEAVQKVFLGSGGESGPGTGPGNGNGSEGGGGGGAGGGGRNVNEPIGGRFPLHYAADFGQLKLLKFFVRMGADVNRKDKYGITPLLAAIWEGHTRCVEFLLQMGASRTELTPTGLSYEEVAEREDIRRLLATCAED
ncbi:hypothetical protein KR018_007043 [Drosophila ironensis]|nr:hypothetical protein KR018_007043 [Drosophila ironensis]